ncbi:TRAM protein [Hibiscus syriacus]|uniref:TRAM protein n=1 Tax=Hibiscus syriacus TaxID=106335 RepID=A0A6A2WIG6_HIBSY|nr:TRAM protein [Hibiscus syriacus]
MENKSYQNPAELLVKEYLLADSFISYTSIICGICGCKMVYDLTKLFSRVYFKSYPSLSKVQRTEWSNRSISTFHAIFITAMSLYFVFWSNLYSDNQYASLVTFRSSALSTFSLGFTSDVKTTHKNKCPMSQVSVGYFLADLGMIIWFYPSLGGMEYASILLFDHSLAVLHHLLSLTAVAYSMLTGEGQLYTFMVLISETTTPGINLRWYLDTVGMKRTRAYLINGVVIFVAWLVARILLFMYLFYHVYLHYDQVKQIHGYGLVLVFVVPSVLSVMNLIWFAKIIRGLRKTIAKRH